MKRAYLTALCVAALLVLFACAAGPRQNVKVIATVPQESAAPILASAAPDAAPATQPAPAVEAAPQPPQPPQPPQLPPVPASPTLPKGHPDISQMMQQQQQQQQPGAGQQLPSGHPDISRMRAPASTRPTMIGKLTVRAVQSTKDAKAIPAGTPVTVELSVNEQVLDKREGKLDESGVATFDAIPVLTGVQPVARVNYNGVDYEAAGSVMDGTHADQQLQVQVYESTETEPAWQIRMQHVMVAPSAEGMQVMEMLAVENPTDRAWIGKAAADGKRTTTVFPLPAGAANVQLAGGFHECCVKTEADRIVNSMALTPGITQFRVVYTVPVKDGKAELSLTAPAAVSHAMFFVPDDGSTVSAQGLESGGVAEMGNGKTRFYKAKDVAAGAIMKLSLSGITARAAAGSNESGPPPAGAALESAASGQIAKVVAGGGGLAIFVVGGMLLLMKSPKRVAKA
jgi:hypothetical protein